MRKIVAFMLVFVMACLAVYGCYRLPIPGTGSVGVNDDYANVVEYVIGEGSDSMDDFMAMFGYVPSQKISGMTQYVAVMGDRKVKVQESEDGIVLIPSKSPEFKFLPTKKGEGAFRIGDKYYNAITLKREMSALNGFEGEYRQLETMSRLASLFNIYAKHDSPDAAETSNFEGSMLVLDLEASYLADYRLESKIGSHDLVLCGQPINRKDEPEKINLYYTKGANGYITSGDSANSDRSETNLMLVSGRQKVNINVDSGVQKTIEALCAVMRKSIG